MTEDPTPMPVLLPCHRHLTFGRQLCSNTGKSERDINGSEFPRHQLHNRNTRTSLADNTNCGFTATPKQQDRGANNRDKEKEKKMPRIKAMTMRYLRSNFFTKVSVANGMRATYSFEPTYRLVDGDLEVPMQTRCDLEACVSNSTKHA